ncbi:hypothetical protein BV898_19104 [Hypsibius exemplaris]|uniref:Tc1-like transposase DDE domain-containing protein n=1 Tax=Hypsibius exemplaris TaxID=2072580 RepID=A0A9X6NKV4_HYPEX|nr:hypothetical protein BV898_19104 [Hypsibius exemplaris]
MEVNRCSNCQTCIRAHSARKKEEKGKTVYAARIESAKKTKSNSVMSAEELRSKIDNSIKFKKAMAQAARAGNYAANLETKTIQLIGYYFTAHLIRSEVLSKIIAKTSERLLNRGIKINCIILDGALGNQFAIAQLDVAIASDRKNNNKEVGSDTAPSSVKPRGSPKLRTPGLVDAIEKDLSGPNPLTHSALSLKYGVSATTVADVFSQDLEGKSVMFVAGVCSRGKTAIRFVKPGAKINSEYYIQHVLKPLFKNDIWKLFPGELINKVVFHHDSAPAHSSGITQEWLRNSGIKFIPKEHWMGNSPDLAPMDFCVNGLFKWKLFAHATTTVAGLKRVMRKVWSNLDQSKINNAYDLGRNVLNL